MSRLGKWIIAALAATSIVSLPLIAEEADKDMNNSDKDVPEKVDQPSDDVAIVVRFYPGGYYRYNSWGSRGYYNPYWHNPYWHNNYYYWYR